MYVDDLLMASKDPQAIVDALMDKHKFKLKGTGPITFHLGCDFFRDEEKTLCMAPRKYIEKMLDNYKRMFGSLPRKAHSPLVQNDHPELDTSELLDYDGIKMYQSLIGALQWVIQIGRWDITTAVMTMSRFRAAPRTGHLERVQRIHGYLRKFKHGVLRMRTDEPDYSDIPEKVYEWSGTCYAGAKEEIPDDIPTPRGKAIVSTHFVDANLYHDLVSGRSVTGILHMWNKCIIDWYSKLQSTVETATFGSEYVAARRCTEQILDLRLTARYLGVPVEGPAMMLVTTSQSSTRRQCHTPGSPRDTMHSRTTRRENLLLPRLPGLRTVAGRPTHRISSASTGTCPPFGIHCDRSCSIKTGHTRTRTIRMIHHLIKGSERRLISLVNQPNRVYDLHPRFKSSVTSHDRTRNASRATKRWTAVEPTFRRRSLYNRY